jgi:hypothetical protein
MGNRAMQLAPEASTSGPNILIVGHQDWTSMENGNGQKMAPSPNDVVQVAGTVRMFDQKEIEHESGGLSNSQMADWQGKPVIIGGSLTLLTPAAGSTGSMGSEGGATNSGGTGSSGAGDTGAGKAR